MRIVTLFYFTLFLLLSNCDGHKVSKVIKDTQEQIDAKTITQKDIDALKYTDYSLSADSQDAVNDWQKFQELNIQIELLKKGDLSYFSQESLIIKTLMIELELEMPKALRKNEILARITALNTKIQKLNSALRINTTSKKEKLQGIKEFLITTSNLNLQLNKKFEFEKNNILKPQ